MSETFRQSADNAGWFALGACCQYLDKSLRRTLGEALLAFAVALLTMRVIAKLAR